MKVAIVNLGQIVTGDWRNPFAKGHAIICDGERIASVGTASAQAVNAADVVIDAGGMTAIPGLIDSHVHITFGDYTPRQRTIGYLESYLHGGTTTAISASEVHVPGRPKGSRRRQSAGGRGAALLRRLPARRHARHCRLGDPGA
jgi:enamidase